MNENEKRDAAVGIDTKMADAAPDAPDVKRCDKTKPFGTPVQVTEFDGTTNDAYMWLTADEKTAYVGTGRTGTLGSVDIWVTSRTSTSDPWGTPTNLTSINSTATDYKAVLTPDQQTIFFDSNRATDSTYDIYVATRTSIAGDFGQPTLVTGINMTGVQDGGPWISPDGLDLYFQSNRSGTYDLYFATRANTSSPFGTPIEIGALNTTTGDESDPALTTDQLTIYFSKNTGNTSEIYVARRSTKSDGFGQPSLVTELSAANPDWPTWVSDDECVIYFGSDRAGGSGSHDIWVATRPQ